MADLTLANLPYLTLLGFVGVAVNILLSFEEPHTGMLVISGVLLAAAPAGLLVHLAFTDSLTAREKRAWIGGLMSRRGGEIFGAYFTSTARHEVTKQLLARGPNSETSAE